MLVLSTANPDGRCSPPSTKLVRKLAAEGSLVDAAPALTDRFPGSSSTWSSRC